jgi:hypothetical protein
MPQGISLSDGAGNAVLPQHPDQCPICHSKIAPLVKFSKLGGAIYRAGVEVVYLCPNTQCNELFIAYFGGSNAPFSLMTTRPVEPVSLTFTDPVKEISENCGGSGFLDSGIS